MKKRNGAVLALAFCLAVLLSGCFFKSVEQLYAVPQVSEDYEALRVRLGELTDMGGEYAAPQSGDRIQSVQLQDLDGDGRQEAVAFFRFPGEEKSLRIYIFRQTGDSYEQMGVIEGSANAINSVDYVQMDNDPYQEIVVSWQLTATLHTLAVYSVGPSQVEELMRTDYDNYKLCDLDQDNQQELIVFRTPADALPRAELYNFDGVLTVTGEASLSAGAFISADGTVKSDYITSLQTGYLTGRVPAVFATSSYGENGAITDIFVCEEGKLRNVTMDPETGESLETIRYYTPPALRDVNGDGIMEVPQPVPLPEYSNRQGVETVSFWLVRWRQFDAAGNPTTISSTYYNDRDSWYFTIPEEWEKNLSLSRSDLTSSGERAVVFSWKEDGTAKPFLTIYKLTGTNRAARAARGQRFIINPAGVDDSTIYAAEFRDGWDSGLTEEDVKARFSVIIPDWYNG